MSSNLTIDNAVGKITHDGSQFGQQAASSQGQTLLSNSNNEYVTVSSPLSFKNKIINGAMTICQRPIYELNAFISGFSGYNLDRWKSEYKVVTPIVYSQTLVSSFESGSTFALNGWTEVNGTQTNKWYIGTFGGSGTTGNSAVISSTGTTKGYNLSSSSIVHIYKDISIPATSTGDFCLKFNGNYAGESIFDYMTVFVAPTSYTPIAGSAPGGTSIFTSYGNTTGVFYYGPFTTSSLNSFKGQTVRIIFTWRNDTSGGTANGGASIDDIYLADQSSASSSGVKTLTQTTQITSISNFESGSTFALNGWIEANGAQTNKWYVGTYGGTGQSGSYSAVISNNGTTKGYTTTAASVVHFYKDVAIPALGSFSSTYLRFNAEVSGESIYDYVQVRVDNTNTTPLAGSLGSTGWSIFRSGSSSGQQSIDITPFSGQTVRLVFTWRNDSSGGTASGGATIDNIEFYQTTPSSINIISQSSEAPSGFKNSMAYECAGFAPSILTQSIEAYNCQDLLFGTSSAKNVSVSFWVRSGQAGTYCAFLQNAAKTLTYIKEYSISSADTWERKTLTIPGCTTGIWTSGTASAYLTLGFSLEDGSTSTSVADSWNSNSYTQTANQTSFAVTENIGKVFYITGIQLEVGDVCTPFEVKPEQTELSLCQRYFQINMAKTVSGAAFGFGVASSASASSIVYKFQSTMRSSPTILFNRILDFSLSDGGALRQISGITANATTTSANLISAATLSNLTANRAQVLVQTGNSLAWLSFTSEI
jgi:hypothetical protein